MKFLYLLFISTLILFSCSEIPTENIGEIEKIEVLDYTTYSINAPNLEFGVISDDTLIEVRVIRDSINKSPKRNIFNGIIKRLSLDSSKSVIADSLIYNHQYCVASCLESMKIEERKLIDSSKMVIDSIKKEVSNGNMTRVQSRRHINQINTNLKKNISILNEKFKVRECMESCDRQFIVEFSKILDPIQLKKFNDWLFMNKLPKEKKRERK
jgi:hypothetical protein